MQFSVLFLGPILGSAHRVFIAVFGAVFGAVFYAVFYAVFSAVSMQFSLHFSGALAGKRKWKKKGTPNSQHCSAAAGSLNGIGFGPDPGRDSAGFW